MDAQKKLMIQMVIFSIIVMSAFILIIFNEVGNPILRQRAIREIDRYIEQNNFEDLFISELSYNNDKDIFYRKIAHPDNKQLYFTVTYHNRTVTSNYEEYFIQGRSLFNYYENKYTALLNTLDSPYLMELIIPVTLNEFNEVMQQNIIESDSLLDFNFYSIKVIGVVENFDIDTLIFTIDELHNLVGSIGFLPSYFSIDFTSDENSLERLIIERIDMTGLDLEVLSNLLLSYLQEL